MAEHLDAPAATPAGPSSPPATSPDEALLLAALAAMAELPITDGPPQPMLTAFAHLAVRAIGPVRGASVVMGSPAEPSLRVSTDRTARALDGAQHRAAQGPIWHAFGSGAAIVTPQLRTDPRWPVLGPLVPPGAHAVTAVPLTFRDERPGGVLTLFGRPELAGSEQVRRAETVAAAASMLLLREHASVGDLRRRLGQLHDALDSRAVIEQARGILMGRYGMDADSAFAELSRRSRTGNVTVREVARRLVSGAGRLSPPDPPGQNEKATAGTRRAGLRPLDPRPADPRRAGLRPAGAPEVSSPG